MAKEEIGQDATNEAHSRLHNLSDKVNQETIMPAIADVEDEFGGDVFDEMDFDSHTDGVAVEPELGTDESDMKVDRRDGSPVKVEHISKSELDGRDRSIPRVQSTPILRPARQCQENQNGPAGKPIKPADHQSANGRVTKPDNYEVRPSAAHLGMVSGQVGSTLHQQNNASTHHVAPSGLSSGREPASKANITSKPSTTASVDDPPVGFTASRNAEILQKIEPEVVNNNNTPLPLIAVAPFNPHLDSPSIRRTGHISHNKSAPVSRQAITAPPPPPGVQSANPDQPISRATNFINPQADPTRKIGMPVAAQSPAPNRSSYKPPGMISSTSNASLPKRGPEQISRVPLADVSNAHPEPGNLDGRDVKKSRMMS